MVEHHSEVAAIHPRTANLTTIEMLGLRDVHGYLGSGINTNAEDLPCGSFGNCGRPVMTVSGGTAISGASHRL